MLKITKFLKHVSFQFIYLFFFFVHFQMETFNFLNDLLLTTIKLKVHTIRFMRPCVTCVYQKSRICVVVYDKLQKKTHRMHQGDLLSTFPSDSCIAGKSQYDKYD